MRNQSEKLIDLFISQFGEKHGYIIYQRIPFTNPWASKEPSYVVSAAERAQFISEFQGKAPLILQRMVRDISIAMISFVASSQVLQIVLGDYATGAELTLLALHLGTIAVVENRRLNTIWDAPLGVMGTRAPAPFAADENRGWTTLLTRLDKRELGLVAAGGLIAAFSVGRAMTEPGAADVSQLVHYAGIALFLALAIAGALCAAEGVVRLSEWFKR